LLDACACTCVRLGDDASTFYLIVSDRLSYVERNGKGREDGVTEEDRPGEEQGDRGVRINWHRVPVSRDELAWLNKRSDIKGLLQAFGHLGLLALTGSLAFYASRHWPWWVTVPLVFMHGCFWAFLVNGFHELCHGTVFATRALNEAFLRPLADDSVQPHAAYRFG
jgi:hypothetical protein